MRFWKGAAVLAVVSVVAGCRYDVAPLDDMQIGIRDDRLQLVTCTPIDAIEIYGTARAESADKLEPFWDASGTVELGSIETISTMFVVSEFSDVRTADEPPLKDGALLEIVIRTEHGDAQHGLFRIRDLNALRTGWMDSSGRIDSTPCTTVSPSPGLS